jgi:hypothetical protein
MSLTVTTTQPVPVPSAAPSSHAAGPLAALMATLMMGAFAAQRSKKQMRKLKWKMSLALAKYKAQMTWRNLFRRADPQISTQTILYILLALLVLILLFLLPPIIAIIVLLVGILLILLMRK